MKTILISFFLIQCLAVYSQYSIYPASDPRSFFVDPVFIVKHSIASCQSESYSSKFRGSGITYFDSLGRSYCFDNFDSTGRVHYTGNYYYDSNMLKPKKFIGVSHAAVGRYEENFYRVYEKGLLKIDSSDQRRATDYFFYDSLGREIKEVSIFKDSNWVRTILKGYVNNTNKLTWIKDYFSKNGKEHLDSDRQFYYDDASNLLKEEELVMNGDSTSNTNSGTIQYCYNKQGLESQEEDPGIVHLFKYYPNGLLSEWSAFFKDLASPWGSKIIHVTKTRYTFY